MDRFEPALADCSFSHLCCASAAAIVFVLAFVALLV